MKWNAIKVFFIYQKRAQKQLSLKFEIIKKKISLDVLASKN